MSPGGFNPMTCIMPRTPALLLFLTILPLALSCSSTRQITTAPPRSGVPVDTSSVSEPRAALAVQVEAATAPLPDGVQSLRFRVSDVWLKKTGEEWIRMPADVNQFILPPTTRATRPVLTALVPPGSYDSLGLSFSDVFVLFDENSGSALTLPREEPVRMAVALETAMDRPSAVRLIFEPAASLTRTEDCRWFFVPFITPSL